MSEGPLTHYRARLHAGEIRADPAQELAAEKLESLHHALAAYRPLPGRGGWKERFGLARSRAEPPQGLYIYGGVGRGKSMLMDLFFRAAPVSLKRRVHFHAFMQEVHARLRAMRQQPRHP
jgi:cell division protein ZapE